MRTVLTLEEADALLAARFHAVCAEENVPLAHALHRVLARDVTARADVPDFIRSTVDGYAVRARDTFGAGESIPALLTCIGAVAMGERAELALASGQCAYVPTGGELPQNADAMVMIEYVNDFGGGAIGVEQAVAPGRHLVLAGDDAKTGAVVLLAGRRVLAQDIGTLAALGYAEVSVRRRPRVTVLSTGDELIDASETPHHGQMRDVNGPMLSAQCALAGAEVVSAGRIRDDAAALQSALQEAASRSELVLLSGGSSVGVRDAAADAVAALGTLLFHGLSVKPGKPTLCGDISGVPVVGLPGHPVAAYFICRLLVLPMLLRMLGTEARPVTHEAVLTAAIPSNHGREEYVPVRRGEAGEAVPVMSKSGLVTTLSQANGYIRIPRDTEGLARGAQVTVYCWESI